VLSYRLLFPPRSYPRSRLIRTLPPRLDLRSCLDWTLDWIPVSALSGPSFGPRSRPRSRLVCTLFACPSHPRSHLIRTSFAPSFAPRSRPRSHLVPASFVPSFVPSFALLALVRALVLTFVRALVCTLFTPDSPLVHPPSSAPSSHPRNRPHLHFTFTLLTCLSLSVLHVAVISRNAVTLSVCNLNKTKY
jgi:hypothetical protein